MFGHPEASSRLFLLDPLLGRGFSQWLPFGGNTAEYPVPENSKISSRSQTLPNLGREFPVLGR